MGTVVTTETLKRAIERDEGMRYAAERWRRSPKGWPDRAMLTDAALKHLGLRRVNVESRIRLFHMTKRAVASS